jgi:hypothetical protein
VPRQTAIDGEIELIVSPAEKPMRDGGITCAGSVVAKISRAIAAMVRCILIAAKLPSVKFTKGLQLQILQETRNETDAIGRKRVYRSGNDGTDVAHEQCLCCIG